MRFRVRTTWLTLVHLALGRIGLSESTMLVLLTGLVISSQQCEDDDRCTSRALLAQLTRVSLGATLLVQLLLALLSLGSDSYSDSDSDEQLTIDEMMERCAFDAAAPRGPCGEKKTVCSGGHILSSLCRLGVIVGCFDMYKL